MTVFNTVDPTSGAPVGGVLLSATSPNNGPWQAVTDAQGHFDAGLGDGVYTVVATKDGYPPTTQVVTVGPVVIAMSGSVPPPQDDAIDLSQVIITAQSPDVRNWPIGTRLTQLMLSMTVNADVTFNTEWPFVIGPEGGDIQYTLWPICQIGGRWYTAGSILCINRSATDHYVPTGPTLQPGQLPNNWYYFAGSPLSTYQPKPGEEVGWFITSGAQRRGDIHTIMQRSQVVKVPFTDGTYSFT